MGTWRAVWVSSLWTFVVLFGLGRAEGQASDPQDVELRAPADAAGPVLAQQRLPRRPTTPAPAEEEKPAEPAPAPGAPPRLPRRPTTPAPAEPAAPAPVARPTAPKTEPADALTPEPDRWRLLLPGATVLPRTPWYDPYNPNVLKGDYPIIGDRTFLSLIGILDSFLDQKRNLDFTKRINNVAFHEDNSLTQVTASLSIELFHGTTVFAPKDWAIRVTPLFRFRCNDNNAQDYQCGTHFTLFEAFGELKLFEIGETFDPTSARLGIQVFNSDFFGFIFNDFAPGLRIFSEIARNQYKVNVAAFARLNKDFLTALNEWDSRELFDFREHEVGVLSFQWDDFIWPGFNILPNFVISYDDKLNETQKAYYIGLATNGRLGPFNVNSAFYYVFGDTADNTFTKKSQNISAGMAFVQVTYPIRFLNPRLAVLYATGDDDPNDDTATGFDGAFDNVNFGGGQFSYLFGEKIQLGNTVLFRGNSVFPSLRAANATSKFDNPGVLIINPGIDVQLTATTIFEANYNYTRFNDTSSLEFLSKRKVSNEAGHEFNAGVTYRPFANEQVIVFAGGAVFLPGDGVKDLFGSSKAAYKALLRLVLTF